MGLRSYIDGRHTFRGYVMDLKRLRYFCTVAEQRSITRASEVLHIAQPALSKRLHELEDELGTTLLVRTGREMQLTEAGAFLYQRACLILRTVEDVRRDTLEFAHHAKRQIKIGISYLYEAFFLPIIVALQHEYPEIELRVSVSDSSHLEFLLNQRIVDVIFAQTPYTSEGYHITHLPAIKLCAVISNSLLAADAPETMSFSEVARLPMILLHRIGGTGIFEYLTDQMRKDGIQPNVLMHVSQPQMVLNLLENGIAAAAFLPESEIKQPLEHGKIITIQPPVSVFHPAAVRLSTGVAIKELDDVIAKFKVPN